MGGIRFLNAKKPGFTEAPGYSSSVSNSLSFGWYV